MKHPQRLFSTHVCHNDKAVPVFHQLQKCVFQSLVASVETEGGGDGNLMTRRHWLTDETHTHPHTPAASLEELKGELLSKCSSFI